MSKYGGANTEQPVATLYVPGNLVNVSDDDNRERPIDYIIHRINMIRDDDKLNNMLILRAGTGVGKSFVLPSEIFKNFNNPTILCVQPTVILAKELARNVLKINSTIYKMGTNIGYITGNEKIGQKGLLFITTGILVLMLKTILDNVEQGKTSKDDPSFILVDEAHKRPLDIEVSLLLIKELHHKMGKRAPFVIFMSATLNEIQISNYYDINLKQQYIEVSGSTSIRVDTYLPYDLNNIYTGIVDKIKEIIEGKYDDILEEAVKVDQQKKKKKIKGGGERSGLDEIGEGNEQLLSELYVLDDKDYERKVTGGTSLANYHESSRDKRKITYNTNPQTSEPNDILVFCPTNKFINRLFTLIIKWLEQEKIPALVISLTSKSYSENAEDVLWLERNISNYQIDDKQIERRIILATNVAESGLTLPALKHLLETGIVNSIEYNPHYAAYCKLQKPTSKDSVQQRIGRVGRNNPGVSHGLYTKKTFDLLDNYNDPEITKQDFSVEYLLLKLIKVDYHDLIDQPLTEMVYHVEDKLYALGFINNDNSLTKIGVHACSFTRIGIESIKMILCGYAFGICVADLVTIAAVIEHISLPTIIPINDQFVTSLLHFEAAMFNDPRRSTTSRLNESGFDQEFFQNFNIKTSISESDISKILSTRWDIVKALSILGFSLYNVPSHVQELINFIKEFSLTEKYIEKNNGILMSEYITKHPAYNTICNFKRCIYEGFKLNTVIRYGSKYLSLKNHQVILPSFFDKSNKGLYNSLGIYRHDSPNVVVGNKFLYEQAFKTDEYEMRTEIISILDGYIGIDVNLFNTYTCDTDRALTESEYNYYINALPKGNLIFGNSYKQEGTTIYGGEDNIFEGYYADDADIDLM
jgi:superfamily II DNA/RNA helicase